VTLAGTAVPFFVKGHFTFGNVGGDDVWNALHTYSFMASYEIVSATPGHWPSFPNRTAGQRESNWLRAHRDDVADADRPWIAILGQNVLVRDSTFDQVYAYLREHNIRDALVACVRPREGPRAYRIA
jgi:hypothetical protein